MDQRHSPCLYDVTCESPLHAYMHGRRSWRERGDANTNCPPTRFCHIGTKMSVLWPSKYAKIVFSAGAPPRGISRRSPRPLSRLERGHPSPYATRLDTDPPSALAMRPPRSPARSTPMPTCTLLLFNDPACVGHVSMYLRPSHSSLHNTKRLALKMYRQRSVSMSN